MARNRRNSDSVSPILEQILFGGSSVSMNMVTLTKSIEVEKRLFRTQALNSVIFFKYPNFDDDGEREQNHFSGEEDLGGGDRPVETGIYAPHSAEHPEAGGVAIYLRSRNSASLMTEQFGLIAGSGEAATLDFKTLELIDSVPSLDAFLLKTCFEAEKLNADPRHWLISNEEDQQLRKLIRQRIEPIVSKAVGGAAGGGNLDRFLDAIWNSSLEEAGLFVSAFGIERHEADAIFSAWKGTTFYEYQLRRIAPRARNILGWLKSKECIPVDIKMQKPYETQLLMHIEKVGKLLETTMLDIRSILAEYEVSFTAFMDGRPGPFRDYLRKIRARYWLLGYCVSALASIIHLDARCMRNNPSRKLYFEMTQNLLRQFEVALDRRRERKGAF